MTTPILTVLIQLPLEWNTHLFFNSDIVNFVWKTDKGEEKSIVLLTFVLWQCFNHRWVRSCGVGQKVLIRASWNRNFFQPGFKPKGYAKICHDPPPPTSTHHQPKYIHHYPPPAKIYLTPHITTQKMDHHPVKARIYSYITTFWHSFNSFFVYEMQYSFP